MLTLFRVETNMTARDSILFKALACAVFLGVAAQTPASAQQAPVVQTEAPVTPSQTMTAQEAEDWSLVSAAFADFQARGYPGLERHRANLRAALARAPASYPVAETRGDRVLLRVEDPIVVLSILNANTSRKSEGLTSPNVYPTIAMMLGSFANEVGNYEEAITVLDKGLAIQPNNPMLIHERGLSLLSLKRPAEAEAAYSAALASDDVVLTSARARFLRDRGIARIDLDRLDDAEADFNESLKIEPGNQTAIHELAYIASVRAGGERSSMVLTLPQAPSK